MDEVFINLDEEKIDDLFENSYKNLSNNNISNAEDFDALDIFGPFDLEKIKNSPEYLFLKLKIQFLEIYSLENYYFILGKKSKKSKIEIKEVKSLKITNLSTNEKDKEKDLLNNQNNEKQVIIGEKKEENVSTNEKDKDRDKDLLNNQNQEKQVNIRENKEKNLSCNLDLSGIEKKMKLVFQAKKK